VSTLDLQGVVRVSRQGQRLLQSLGAYRWLFLPAHIAFLFEKLDGSKSLGLDNQEVRGQIEGRGEMDRGSKILMGDI
jgi:hypothetical protein